MTLKLAEGAVTAVSAYLSTNFGAKVTALNAEYADTVVLTVPAKFAITEILETDAYPMVEILCDRTTTHGIAGDYIGTSHDITIICTVLDDSDVGEEKANLRKRVYRYARAIVELCRSAQATGGFSDGGTPAASYQVQLMEDLIDFSPAVRRKGTSLVIAACGVHIQMQIQEAG